jgi:hypothetical protein
MRAAINAFAQEVGARHGDATAWPYSTAALTRLSICTKLLNCLAYKIDQDESA